MSTSTAAVYVKFSVSYIINYCYGAAAALVVYEHIITFDLEVFAIWRYRMAGPTILLFNRYVLLLTTTSYVFNIITWTTDQISICKAQTVLNNVTYPSSIVIVAGFSALRVYAVAERNWCWSLLALLTGLVPAATNIYKYISVSHPYVAYSFGIPQCFLNIPFSDSAVNRLVIITRTCAIASDLVVIVATWIYARPWANHVPGTQIKTPLMLVIVRDGTGYFIVLLILNITQMAIEQISFSASGTLFLEYITAFIPVISSILISRFIFNLRLHIDEENGTESNDTSFAAGSMGSRGSIEFGSRLIGNMGAPLDHSIPDSLLFDDDDEPHEDIGYNEELPVEQMHNFQRDGEGRSDAPSEFGAGSTP